MNKTTYVLIVIMLISLATNLRGEQSNPLDDMLNGDKQQSLKAPVTSQDDSLSNDIIMVNYEKKNARLAMLMSAIIPGAGQFYADKSSITAYLFPVIEAAVIGGMIYYDKRGNKKSAEYKKYATETVTFDIDGYTYTGPRYRRDYQSAVQDTLIRIHSNDIYDGLFFSLDPTDSQHFFEDIGKYDKYIFGWVDWYYKYAQVPPFDGPPDPHPIFVYDISDPANQLYNSPDNKWQFNVPLVGDPTNDRPNSALRSVYIKMRKQAEDEYRVAHSLSFGLALNHIVSAIDAMVLTNKMNRLYLSENTLRFRYYADIRNGHLTPTIGLNLSF
jgi:hypothetical protein